MVSLDSHSFLFHSPWRCVGSLWCTPSPCPSMLVWRLETPAQLIGGASGSCHSAWTLALTSALSVKYVNSTRWTLRRATATASRSCHPRQNHKRAATTNPIHPLFDWLLTTTPLCNAAGRSDAEVDPLHLHLHLHRSCLLPNYYYLRSATYSYGVLLASSTCYLVLTILSVPPTGSQPLLPCASRPNITDHVSCFLFLVSGLHAHHTSLCSRRISCSPRIPAHLIPPLACVPSLRSVALTLLWPAFRCSFSYSGFLVTPSTDYCNQDPFIPVWPSDFQSFFFSQRSACLTFILRYSCDLIVLICDFSNWGGPPKPCSSTFADPETHSSGLLAYADPASDRSTSI